MQLQRKFIAANAVDQTKIRLSNNAYLKARNAADSADINMLKVNASDRIEFSSIPQVTSDPSSGNDLVRKSYLDAVQQGLKPKQAVRAATTANIVIATALNSGDVIDGVTLSNGDRVLVKNQSASEENGIYIVGASPARSSDFDSLSPIDEINGAYTFVQEGSANQGKAFVQSGTVATLDTDPISFVFFNSAGTLVGGDGITISGADVSVDHDGQGLQFSSNQLALELDGSTLSKSASGLKVASLGITASELASNAVTTAKINNDAVDKDKIAADVAGNGLGQNVDGSLEVNVDGSTLEINSDSLRVKDLGISSSKLAADSVITSKILDSNVTANKLASDSVTTVKILNANVTTAKLADDSVDKDKINANVAGNGLGQNVDGSLEVNVDGSTLEINADSLRVKDLGITNAKVATGIDAAKLADGSVSNAEFQYINSLTSNAQTQLNNKLETDLSNIGASILGVPNGGTGSSSLAANNVLLGNGTSALQVVAPGTSGNILTSNGTTWTSAAPAVAYTDEMAQDAVGGILTDSSTIDFTYNDAGNTITAIVIDSSISAAKLASDSVTTVKILDANVTAAKLASDSVITAKILDSNVTAAKLASDSVTTVKILDANVTNAKIATGIDSAKLADGSVSNAEFQYINSLSSNAQDQLNARLRFAPAELLTLDGTDITNQYKDLSFVAASSDSISLTPVGGIMQERGVDYSVSLTGGAGGVTRITFLGDLASGGAAELISGDKLMVQYARL